MLSVVLGRRVGYAGNMAIKITDDKAHVARFLSNHNIGTLATADAKARPHAATIYFTVDDRLEFYFVTKEDTAKHRNLQENPWASLAVYEADSQTTMQASGPTVQLAEDDKRLKNIFNEIVGAAESTSESGVPPISQMPAGKYVVYQLQPETVRLAQFDKPEHGWLEKLFDVID